MSEKIHHHTLIPIEYCGKRLDWVLAKLFPQYSRNCLQQWLRDQQILVDDKAAETKTKVKGGEKVVIDALLTTQTIVTAQNIALNIVYEDSSILVINKPVGLVVHPAAGNPDQTLLNALLHYHPDLALIPRGGIVHRLDKDTSGLIVIAKTLDAHHHLVQQLQSRQMGRIYTAIVNGVLTASGTIELPLGRDPRHRTKIAVLPNGKPAITHYKILQKFPYHTLLSIRLETGRTHQIRVHLAHINHPIVGDQTYGGRMRLPKQCNPLLKETLQNFKRQALHAKQLQLIHPITGDMMNWEIDLAPDMQILLDELIADKKLRDSHL